MRYSFYEEHLSGLTAQRDALANQIKTVLDGAEFHGAALDHKQASELFFEGELLLFETRLLSGSTH